MHPAMIKAHLEMTGLFQADIARAVDVTPGLVGNVIHGVTRSRKVEDAIAAVLDKSLHELWPAWYGKDGLPVAKRRARAINTSQALQRLAATAGAR